MKKKNDAHKGLRSLGEKLTAAPASTKNSEAELRKYEMRKAVSAAEEAQELERKSSEVPSDEDIFTDMVRVASSEVLNPQGYKDRTLTHKRYKRLGHYPIEVIYDRFGQFAHAKQVAGLEDEPGTRQTKRATAQSSRNQHAQRYIEETMRPYAANLVAPELERELRGDKLMLSISDTHAGYLDPFTWWSFLKACKALKPDYILFNGDILEGSSISTHPKVPGKVIPLAVEFEFAREMFLQTREAVGQDAEILYTAGNHGLDRWARYLTQTAPSIAGLPTMRFDKLLDLDDLNVRLVMGGKICSPEGNEFDLPGIMMHNFYYPYHGKKLGKYPAAAELDYVGYSGQSGHVHRSGLAFGTDLRTMGKSWMSTPMACRPEVGAEYMGGATTGWQMGWGFANLMPNQRVHQYPVLTHGGVAFCEGHRWEMKRALKKQDPQTNWLKNFEAP